MRAAKRFCVAALVAAGVVACATVNRPPGLSVEGALAIDGKRVTDGIASAARLVDAAVTNKDMVPQLAYDIVKPLNLAATEAVRLAVALEAIDAATTEAGKVAGIEKAKPILEAIRKALNDGVARSPGGAAEHPVVAGIRSALSVVLSLMARFGIPVADLRPWEAGLVASAAAESRGLMPLAIPIGLLLQLLPYLMQAYATERQRWIEAHPGESVPFPTDAELIAGFRSSAEGAAGYTDGLLARLRAQGAVD